MELFGGGGGKPKARGSPHTPTPPERNSVKNFMNLHLGHSRNVFHPGNPRMQSTVFSKGFYNGVQWGSGIHVIVLCFERWNYQKSVQVVDEKQDFSLHGLNCCIST